MEANAHLFGQIAPTLSTAMNGPCATMAQRFLMEGLKSEEIDVDIRQPLAQQAWMNDTRAMQIVRKLEQDFQQELKSLGLGPEALQPPAPKAAQAPSPRYKNSDQYRPQLIMSAVFMAAYFLILGAIIYIEASDTLNMHQGENSFMDQIQILIGVLTAGVGQILSYWFGGMMGGGKDKDD